MAITLEKLPFALDALEPCMSKETLEYHYGKHHKAYVDKLNKLIKSTDYDSLTLEEIVLESSQNREAKILHNAAQAWNHGFFWRCLISENEVKPGPATLAALKENFGGLTEFKKNFTIEASELFGSGWTWLVRKLDGSLAIEPLSDEKNPLLHDYIPLLTCDVWEHAYYIDYRNERAKFIDAFWRVVNWDFVEKNIMLSESGREPFVKSKGTDIQPALQ